MPFHDPCPYCGARYTGPYGWPHICKELIYMSMPILRFEQFEVRSLPPAEKRLSDVERVNDKLPKLHYGWPLLADDVRAWEVEEVREAIYGGAK